MNKCAYCGREYSDDIARCPIDNTLLTGGGAKSLPSQETNSAASTVLPTLPPILRADSLPPTPIKTERKIRIIELALVCLIAFGGSIFASTYYLIYGLIPNNSMGATAKWPYNIMHEAASLGLLGYVLMRRSKSYSDLGISWTKRDFGTSILLWIGGGICVGGIYRLMKYGNLTPMSQASAVSHVGQYLFAGGVSIWAIAFQFLNPFFEELIVRAYVMTEIRYLTNSVSGAVIFSTALQMSYHFYQGAPLALSYGAEFLIFSIYYAKTNRITPIILAHLYFDVLATLMYAARQGSIG